MMSLGLVRVASMALIFTTCLGRVIPDPPLPSVVLRQNEPTDVAVAAFPKATPGPEISLTHKISVEYYSRTMIAPDSHESSAVPTIVENWTEYCKGPTTPPQDKFSARCDPEGRPVMMNRKDRIWQRDTDVTGAPKFPASSTTAITSSTYRPKSKPVQLSRAENLYKNVTTTTHAKRDVVIAKHTYSTAVADESLSSTTNSFPTLTAIPRASILARGNPVSEATPTANGHTDYSIPTAEPYLGKTKAQNIEIYQPVSGFWRRETEYRDSDISTRQTTPFPQDISYEKEIRSETDQVSYSGPDYPDIVAPDGVIHRPVTSLLRREDVPATEVDSTTSLKDEKKEGSNSKSALDTDSIYVADIKILQPAPGLWRRLEDPNLDGREKAEDVYHSDGVHHSRGNGETIQVGDYKDAGRGDFATRHWRRDEKVPPPPDRPDSWLPTQKGRANGFWRREDLPQATRSTFVALPKPSSFHTTTKPPIDPVIANQKERASGLYHRQENTQDGAVNIGTDDYSQNHYESTERMVKDSKGVETQEQQVKELWRRTENRKSDKGTHGEDGDNEKNRDYGKDNNEGSSDSVDTEALISCGKSDTALWYAKAKELNRRDNADEVTGKITRTERLTNSRRSSRHVGILQQRDEESYESTMRKERAYKLYRRSVSSVSSLGRDGARGSKE